MALQNKVDPFGNIVAIQMRGQLMGNRGGRIHDPETRALLPKRRWATRQWICCLTEFKARHRKVMGKGYTELFFLDEVSAFAAGHRPCYECRRKAATDFARCWAEAHNLEQPPKAGEMDIILHQQRLDDRNKRTLMVKSDDLPDGAMIELNEQFFARQNDRWHRWSPNGYIDSMELSNSLVRLLTPPTIIGVLRKGYSPQWYKSE